MKIKMLIAMALVTVAAHAKEQNSDNCKKAGSACICFNKAQSHKTKYTCVHGSYTNDDGAQVTGLHCSCRD